MQKFLQGRKQRGFTLIELLVVIGIIGILSRLALSSFWVYRSSAAYSVAQTTITNSRIAVEASENNLDSPPVSVSFSQTAPGAITNTNGSKYLPGMQLSKQLKLTATYDSTCTTSTCQADFLQVKHCLGTSYIQWIRFGDNVETTLDHIAGAGCT